MEYVRDRVAPHLRVRRVEFFELSKTISGKIRRIDLRRREDDAYAAGAPITTEYRYEDLVGLAMKSYDAGPTNPPLLEETIGQNFECTVARNPDAEALVEVAGNRRWTYAELNTEIDLVARGLMALGVQRGQRVGIWFAELCRVDHRPVRHGEDRRHFGQHQSRLPHQRARLCAEPVGCSDPYRGDGVQEF
jgi:AMP-binding enzyme